jgi:hypothetical protein
VRRAIRFRLGLGYGINLLCLAACGRFGAADPEASASGDDAAAADVPDAGATVSDASSASAFCATLDASFCWSFDEGPEPRAGRGLVVDVAGAAGADLTTAPVASTPFAMRLRVSAAGEDGGTQAVGVGLDGLAGAPSRGACEADVFVVGVMSRTFVPLIELRTSDSAAQLVGTYFGGSNVVAIRASGSEATRIVAVVPVNQWIHLVLDVDASDGAIIGRVVGDNLRTDGEVVSQAEARLSDEPMQPPLVAARWSADSAEPFQIVVDNLVCRFD